MATYTIRLKEIFNYIDRTEVEKWFSSYTLEDYLLPSQIEILSKYNIFTKEKLAKKIVNHYFMHEIGFETIELFKRYAKITMEEIMESKLPLIYSALLDYDPLINEDYTETFERETENLGNSKQDTSQNTTGTSSSNSNANSSGLSINSDTPQGKINKQAILEGSYASSTSANENTSNINDDTSINNNSTGSNNITDSNHGTENFTRKFKGNHGVLASYPNLIKQFRENIVAVQKDIIDELNILFMGLF